MAIYLVNTKVGLLTVITIGSGSIPKDIVCVLICGTTALSVMVIT